MTQEQLDKIEAQLQQAQQERAEIQSQLSEILFFLKQWRPYDPSELESQLLEIKTELLEARKERFQLQSLVSDMPSRLQKANQEIVRDVATELTEPLLHQLSDLQGQFQKEIREIQSLLEKNNQKQTPNVNEPIPVGNSDYEILRNLLAAGKWKEADIETKNIWLKVCGLEKENRIDKAEIKKLPCEALRAIDQLWVNYSNERFGFSVQRRIFESIGGKVGVDDYTKYCCFGERVGWLVGNRWLCESDLEFALNAPLGHFPVAPFFALIRGIRSRKLYFSDFFGRIDACGV
jgi:ribosomal protein L29